VEFRSFCLVVVGDRQLGGLVETADPAQWHDWVTAVDRVIAERDEDL
jgi:hypothetical protein